MIEWLAGFFDGEGSVGCVYEHGRLAVRLQIVQRGRETLDEIRDELACGRIYAMKPTTQSMGLVGERPEGYFILQIRRRDDVRRVIETLRPHARVKREQFDLSIRILDLLGLDPRDPRLPDLAAQLRALKGLPPLARSAA